jgi:hypothetical protein
VTNDGSLGYCSKCLLDKAFEQGDNLTSTVGTKIINEIE